MLGRKVATLVNAREDADYYSVSWNAGSETSGVYFAVISARDLKGNQVYSNVEKLLLMK